MKSWTWLLVAVATGLAGCGRAPSTVLVAPKAQRELVMSRSLPSQPAKGQGLAAERGTQGSLINGRWYEAGQEPSTEKLELPQPEAGKGHLTVDVALRNVTSIVGAYRVELIDADTQELLVEATFQGEALKGSSLVHSFTDLEPGNYRVRVAVVAAGRLAKDVATPAQVVADASQVVKLKP